MATWALLISVSEMISMLQVQEKSQHVATWALLISVSEMISMLQVQEKSQHMAMGALPAALTVVLQDELVEQAQAGGESRTPQKERRKEDYAGSSSENISSTWSQ
jgi:DNA replicative helicase MCM subunit Mcm2 (Cdc46/Mcm family)